MKHSTYAAPCGAIRHRRAAEDLRGSYRVAALQAGGGDGHGDVPCAAKPQRE